jgi:hypothetical protein
MPTDVPMTTPQCVPIAQLRLHDDFQVRVQTDRPTAELYRDLMLEGVTFPPLEVVDIDGKNQLYLVDGRHRREALLMIGKKTAMCVVTVGTRAYATLRACAANAHHPKQMGSADKRRAVQRFLCEPEFNDPEVWSDRRVGEVLGVGHVFVGKIREELYPDIREARSSAREQKKLEREVEVNRPNIRTTLDKADLPPNLPPPVPTSVRPVWRNQGASRVGSRRPSAHAAPTVARHPLSDHRAAEQMSALPSDGAYSALTSLPTGAALQARLKARNIQISWQEHGETRTASLSDLSKVPDDVVKYLIQCLQEELAKRLRRRGS